MPHRWNIVLSAAAAIVSLTSLVCSAVAEDWPRFRGPNGAGASETAGIPVEWTDKDYRWKVALPGNGHSSPIVCGGRVFVTSAAEDSAQQVVSCLNAADGKVAWKREFASATHRKNKLNSYAASTPAADASRLFFAWAKPESFLVVALSQATGEELWRQDLGPFAAEHGFGASPIVFEDLLIVSNDQDAKSFVRAIDCATGKTRWQAERRTEKAGYSTPFVYQAEGGPPQLILTNWAQGFSSLDPRSGKANWELPLFKSNRIVGSPMIASGLIFAAAGVGGTGRQMYAVRPGDPGRGTAPQMAYELEKPLPYVCTPVAKGPLLFIWNDQGVVSCLDAASGKVHWRERVGGDYFCSPIRVADRLYCASRKGEMVVLAAADHFKVLARFSLGEPTQATPAVAGDTMYLRTLSHVMAIGASRKNQSGRANVESPVSKP